MIQAGRKIRLETELDTVEEISTKRDDLKETTTNEKNSTGFRDKRDGDGMGCAVEVERGVGGSKRRPGQEGQWRQRRRRGPKGLRRPPIEAWEEEAAGHR